MSISAIGALVAILVAIIVIVLGVHPAYGMLLGALAGGIVGGAALGETVSFMFTGAAGMSTSLLRIMAAGVMSGALIKSGAAEVIAKTIVKKFGATKALAAITVSVWLLTGIGIFGDVATLTIAPLAIEIGLSAGYTKSTILVAMVCGMHSGQMVSSNPQAIALADYFGIPLTNMMLGGLIPSLCGLVVAILLANHVRKTGKGSALVAMEGTTSSSSEEMPSFAKAIAGPVVAIILLALKPLAGITIDPLIALPIGGLVCCLCQGKGRNFGDYAAHGLQLMSGVVILLLGTGALAGIISNSALKDVLIHVVEVLGLPGYLLAPLAGVLMGGATASCTGGSTTAANAFGEAILGLGTKPLQAAVMIHAGANVIDGLPHGSYFHTAAGSVGMGFKERLRCFPYEACIGITMTIVSTIIYGILGFNF